MTPSQHRDCMHALAVLYLFSNSCALPSWYLAVGPGLEAGVLVLGYDSPKVLLPPATAEYQLGSAQQLENRYSIANSIIW